MYQKTVIITGEDIKWLADHPEFNLSGYLQAQLREMRLKNAVEKSQDIDGNSSGYSKQMEIALAFIREWQRVNHKISMGSEKSKSIMDNLKFRVDYHEGRAYIHFTSSAFKTATRRLYPDAPFPTAKIFINSIIPESEVRVENRGKAHSVRIGNQPLTVYTISVKTY